MTTDNTAELQARVRELEKQLGAADKMREAAQAVVDRNSSTKHQGVPTVQMFIYEMNKAIAAYDAARGK